MARPRCATACQIARGIQFQVLGRPQLRSFHPTQGREQAADLIARPDAALAEDRPAGLRITKVDYGFYKPPNLTHIRLLPEGLDGPEIKMTLATAIATYLKPGKLLVPLAQDMPSGYKNMQSAIPSYTLRNLGPGIRWEDEEELDLDTEDDCCKNIYLGTNMSTFKLRQRLRTAFEHLHKNEFIRMNLHCWKSDAADDDPKLLAKHIRRRVHLRPDVIQHYMPYGTHFSMLPQTDIRDVCWVMGRGSESKTEMLAKAIVNYGPDHKKQLRAFLQDLSLVHTPRLLEKENTATEAGAPILDEGFGLYPEEIQERQKGVIKAQRRRRKLRAKAKRAEAMSKALDLVSQGNVSLEDHATVAVARKVRALPVLWPKTRRHLQLAKLRPGTLAYKSVLLSMDYTSLSKVDVSAYTSAEKEVVRHLKECRREEEVKASKTPKAVMTAKKTFASAAEAEAEGRKKPDDLW